MPPSFFRVTGLDGFPTVMIGLLVIYMIVWLIVMASLLDRPDMTSTNRFLWVFILVMVPVFGVLFYWFSRASTTRYCSTDQPLKVDPVGPPVLGPLDCPRCGTRIHAEQCECPNCQHQVPR